MKVIDPEETEIICLLKNLFFNLSVNICQELQCLLGSIEQFQILNFF